jgi:VWFA-related protein
MRRILAGLVCAVALLAQSPKTPVFRSNTQLVELSVVAVDKKGNPVTDLKADEIEIRDGSERREAAIFRLEGLPTPVKPERGKGLVFSNYAERAPGSEKHVVAVVLDTINSSPESQNRAKIYALLYLKTLAPNSLVAIYELGRKPRVLHEFSSDGESLRERLEKMKYSTGTVQDDIERMIADASVFVANFPEFQDLMVDQIRLAMSANAARVRDRATFTMAGLEAIGAHLGAIPGRKSLVWISEGVPSSYSVSSNQGSAADVTNWSNVIRDAGRRLAQNGVALYAVEARGLETPMTGVISAAKPESSNAFLRQPKVAAVREYEEMNADTLGTAHTLADSTGGRVFRNSNDLAAGLRLATSELEGAYTVAFYSNAEPDGKWHSVKLKCSRGDVRLTARPGYLAEAQPTPRTWVETDWDKYLADPMPANTLAASVRCVPKSDGQLDLTLSAPARAFLFDGDRKAEIEFVLAQRTASGEFGYEAKTLKLNQPGSADKMLDLFHCVMQPSPAAAYIRMGVRDRKTNLYGVVDVPLDRVRAAASSKR